MFQKKKKAPYVSRSMDSAYLRIIPGAAALCSGSVTAVGTDHTNSKQFLLIHHHSIFLCATKNGGETTFFTKPHLAAQSTHRKNRESRTGRVKRFVLQYFQNKRPHAELNTLGMRI